MRKKVFGKKLNRNRRSRNLLFRSLVKSMILHGETKTTRAKAQAVVPLLEKLVSMVKKNDLAARRDVLARLGNDKDITDMFFSKYSSLVNSRQSGFTKVTRLPNRRGDDAEMVKVSWVEMPAEEKKEVKKKGKDSENVSS